ncbi:MAG: PilZ domain-containing protein [Candidatus Omnitrophica bacterium]|nr:PilZ domain-containing protein [Candidatus Omnitrophota bacterium]
MKSPNVERRKYLRIEVPLNLRIITESGDMDSPKVKNISPLGIRFETKKQLKDGDHLELTLELPKAKNPVHIHGKIIWHKKTSLEDNASFDVGCEFIRIEEDNKNTFLKYFCDLIYKQKAK